MRLRCLGHVNIKRGHAISEEWKEDQKARDHDEDQESEGMIEQKRTLRNWEEILAGGMARV